jgi:hypothetical protein
VSNASAGRKPKEKGYRTEIKALRELQELGFERMTRTGSVNYKADAPDLVQEGKSGVTLCIVATQDERSSVLYTMSRWDLMLFRRAVEARMLDEIPVAVQVKRRKKTWISGIYQALVKKCGVL